MIELNVTNLVGGNITITTGSATRAVTRIWWSDDESDYSDCPSNNGTFDSNCFPEGKSNTDAVKVEFGSDVTSIGDYAFYECSGLMSVTFPNSVTSIGGGAFTNCYGLTIVTMPSVTTIKGTAFACTSLTNVSIGSDIQGIGSYAFEIYGSPITLTIDKTVAEVQAMGQTDYDSDTNVPYSEWYLPSGSTIVCTNGTIPIE